ncbi:MAG: hypothetical protein E6Q67_14290 [Roseateles sp.]|nr:MAG: hypothetical protein E6Q67_14290 [Roseateles sp.]
MQPHENADHGEQSQPAPEGLGSFEQLQGHITLIALVMHKRREAIAQLQARNLADQALQDTMCAQLLTLGGAVMTMNEEGTVSMVTPGADGESRFETVFKNEAGG